MEAFDFAHSKGFVHRDIKPSNLLVANPGSDENAHLADFGLAKVYQDSRLSGFSMTGLTKTGELCCSYPYVAPEQITNYRDTLPSADLYSAGATLYHLLTGHYIFDFPKRPEQQLLMILQDPHIPITQRRPDIPGAILGAM